MMAKILKILTTIKNNWKKSALGSVLILYGAKYAKNKYEISELMREYCKEAIKYGEQPSPLGSKLRQIIVILNPAANKRKAKANFEKFCGPLLYLAGINVTVVQTEYEGQARGLVEDLGQAVDALVVARRWNTLRGCNWFVEAARWQPCSFAQVSVGILPLGQTNTVANSLFAVDSNFMRTMANATMAIIREVTKPLDVMKVEALETEDELPGKPVYCLAGIRWGAYRDAHARKDKYWYWDGLRSYAAYVFGGMKSGLSWHCDAKVKYALPCAGCSKCCNATDQLEVGEQNGRSRLWQLLLPWRSRSGTTKEQIDYSKVQNNACGLLHSKETSAVEFSLTTENIYQNSQKEGVPFMKMVLGPPNVSYTDFVLEGWKRVNGQEPHVAEKLQVRELELQPVQPPKDSKDNERWISIDNEDYELKPMHITLLRRKFMFLCQ